MIFEHFMLTQIYGSVLRPLRTCTSLLFLTLFISRLDSEFETLIRKEMNFSLIEFFHEISANEKIAKKHRDFS